MPHKSHIVVWRCPHGHPTMTGFLLPSDSSLRICAKNIGNEDGDDPIQCNEIMDICYDERPKVEGPLTEGATEDEKRVRLHSALKKAQNQLIVAKATCSEIIAEMGQSLKGIRKVRT